MYVPLPPSSPLPTDDKTNNRIAESDITADSSAAILYYILSNPLRMLRYLVNLRVLVLQLKKKRRRRRRKG